MLGIGSPTVRYIHEHQSHNTRCCCNSVLPLSPPVEEMQHAALFQERYLSTHWQFQRAWCAKRSEAAKVSHTHTLLIRVLLGSSCHANQQITPHIYSPEQRKQGVIAASAGNHALGLAYHGQLLNIPVTLVMPVSV